MKLLLILFVLLIFFAVMNELLVVIQKQRGKINMSKIYAVPDITGHGLSMKRQCVEQLEQVLRI